MKNQTLEYEKEEDLFRRLVSRNHLKNQQLFVYKENLVFSVLNLVAESNPAFPQKWNFDNVAGPLKSFCSGNGGLNEILGVSSAMLYGGTIGTFSSWHVEDADYPSANIMFPWSAGKAWIGVHPEDQWKLDAYISKKFRTRCPSPMLHKDLMLDIDLLDELGIRWYYFIQRPGDIIITNPSAPHQVVNLGYNLNEATNFYAFRHLVSARRRVACACPSRLKLYENDAWKRLGTFVYSGEFKFLCKSQGIPVPTPDQILTQILDEFDQFNASFSNESLLSHSQNPKKILTLADALKAFTQSKELLEKENGGNEIDESPAAVYCEVTATAPLDLTAFLESPPLPAIQSPEAQLESNVGEFVPITQPDVVEPSLVVQPNESSYIRSPRPPKRSSLPPSRSMTPTSVSAPGSPDIFASPESSQPASPRGRKRPPPAQLFEDPSQKARRLNARADFFSQLNWNRNRSSPPQSPPMSSLESPIAPPATNDVPSTPAQSSRTPDPRVDATERILRNSHTYTNYKESRDKARDTYVKKNGKGPSKNGKASSWFKSYIQCASRRIETAENNVSRYGGRRRRSGACDWNVKLEDAKTIKKHLEHRRLLHNVLQTMYKHCSEDLQERLDEGYLEQEIFRDFVYFHSEENMGLLRASLAAHSADFTYWENVITNEEAWNAEFGVDKKYRIPCVEFSKLKFGVLDLL